MHARTPLERVTSVTATPGYRDWFPSTPARATAERPSTRHLDEAPGVG